MRHGKIVKKKIYLLKKLNAHPFFYHPKRLPLEKLKKNYRGPIFNSSPISFSCTGIFFKTKKKYTRGRKKNRPHSCTSRHFFQNEKNTQDTTKKNRPHSF